MIDLYTWTTPNGRKASIALEEMGMDYTVHPMPLREGPQKEPWFLDINPNGRIPAIVDRDAEEFAVFESGAILIYLAEKSGRYLPTDREKRSRVFQWLMWQMGGLGPMQGQAHVFARYLDEKIALAISRYQKETRRLYEVMDTRLGEFEYLAGEYSIADMACFPWMLQHAWAGVAVDDLEHVTRWMNAMHARPAVKRGLDVPKPFAPPTADTGKVIARLS